MCCAVCTYHRRPVLLQSEAMTQHMNDSTPALLPAARTTHTSPPSHTEHDPSTLAVLIYSLFRPELDRRVRYDWWPAQHGYRVYGYNISTAPAVIHTFDGTITKRLYRPIDAGLTGRDLTLARQAQQCRDVFAVLHHWNSTQCAGHRFFLLVEDDIRPCHQSQLLFQQVNDWAHRHYQHWGMIRVAVGLTGVILKCEHLDLLLAFLVTNRMYGNFAIDVAIAQFFLEVEGVGHQRVYRYSLSDHMGEVSNIWVR